MSARFEWEQRGFAFTVLIDRGMQIGTLRRERKPEMGGGNPAPLAWWLYGEKGQPVLGGKDLDFAASTDKRPSQRSLVAWARAKTCRGCDNVYGDLGADRYCKGCLANPLVVSTFTAADLAAWHALPKAKVDP